MNQAAVCFVLVLAVQCLAFAHAQSNSNDARLVTTSTVVEKIDLSQDAPSPDGSRVAPLAGDHDLVLGVCADNNYNLVAIDNIFGPAFPNNGVNVIEGLLTFNDVTAKIVCIKMLDTKVNGEGEDLGGYPSVSDGGLGFYYVNMVFTSQPGQSMFFHFEVYALGTETTTDTTSTTAKGAAEAVGIARGNWLALSAIVLISKCVSMGN